MIAEQDPEWRRADHPLASWRPAHAALARIDRQGRLILHAENRTDFHFLRVVEPRAPYGEVRLEVTLAPIPRGTAAFTVSGWGDVDLAVVSREGRVIHEHREGTVQVSAPRKDGFFTVTVTYQGAHPTISIGTYDHTAFHPGSGRDEFAFEQISVWTRGAESRLGVDKLVLVDVGAEGGLQDKWFPFAPDLDVVYVEPSPETANDLRRNWPESRVLEVGLLNEPGVRPLNITRLSGCSSILVPNTELLRRWSIGPLFDVVRTVEVSCERYDALHVQGGAPAPDAIKIDVQGVELEVLQGFGDLLSGCLGVELEAHFYPIYRGQHLLHEIIEHLAGFGLVLRRLEPQMNFDADLVEVNAYFTQTAGPETPEGRRRKLELIEDVWGLKSYPSGPEMARSVGIDPQPTPGAPLRP